MPNFSYVKALEAEVADLKAELVELSAKIRPESRGNSSTDPFSGSEPLVAAFTAGALGLLAGYALGTRGYLSRH